MRSRSCNEQHKSTQINWSIWPHTLSQECKNPRPPNIAADQNLKPVQGSSILACTVRLHCATLHQQTHICQHLMWSSKQALIWAHRAPPHINRAGARILRLPREKRLVTNHPRPRSRWTQTHSTSHCQSADLARGSELAVEIAEKPRNVWLSEIRPRHPH